MKPYRTKSIKAAQAMVCQLRRQIAERDKLLNRFHRELFLLAKLASRTPQFDNPFYVMEAEKIRDRILNA